MIKFVDLKKQYDSIKEEIDSAVSNVINETAFVAGKYADKFEKEFSEFIGVRHCVACANGTDSLEILLKAMGVGHGDEVIVPAISWLSTSEAVSTVGGTPIFVDIDPVYYTIDLAKIEEKITSNTKVIIPVHLYGQPVDMITLMKIAKKHKLKVLEDCAQAHAAEFNGQKIGTFGDCASFSFYPGKNLGAYGDAGGMLTNDDNIARTARRISNHGQEGKHNHISEGRNSRMDGLHAAILSVKLPHLNKWTDARRKNAKLYSDLLTGVGDVVSPNIIDNGKHVFHLNVIRTSKRDDLMTFLSDNNIGVAIHYPKALPFLQCYDDRGFKESDYPVAAKLQTEILSLPLFAELTEEEINDVVNKIKEFFAK